MPVYYDGSVWGESVERDQARGVVQFVDGDCAETGYSRGWAWSVESGQFGLSGSLAEAKRTVERLYTEGLRC